VFENIFELVINMLGLFGAIHDYEMKFWNSFGPLPSNTLRQSQMPRQTPSLY
jgi:hypothetical protein